MAKQLSLYTLGDDLPLPTQCPSKTLRWARKRLQNDAWDGVECPCCGALAKVYRRNLNSGMCRVLLRIAKVTASTTDQDGWVHITDIFGKHGAQVHRDWYVLRHWKLIEQKPPGRTQDKNASGFWRLTKVGMGFARAQVKVPKYVYIYYNELVKYSEECVSIQEALGKQFVYEEIV